jgi:hypothetical protein
MLVSLEKRNASTFSSVMEKPLRDGTALSRSSRPVLDMDHIYMKKRGRFTNLEIAFEVISCP